VPSANDLVERGAVPGRPDMTFRWAHDETEVTFQTLVDGEPRTFVTGEQRGDLFYDADGEAIARIVRDESGRRTLVTTLDALDAAEARFRARDGATVPDAASDDFAPKLCPDPSPEPKTTKSENSIRYQEYVSKLPYGSAIKVGGVKFDGCDPATGNLLEAKANIDHLFDGNDNLYWWVEPKGDPTGQMQNQSDVARAAGRSVIWHAQTETGFRGLSRIKSSNNWPNLFVVYDPN